MQPNQILSLIAAAVVLAFFGYQYFRRTNVQRIRANQAKVDAAHVKIANAADNERKAIEGSIITARNKIANLVALGAVHPSVEDSLQTSATHLDNALQGAAAA